MARHKGKLSRFKLRNIYAIASTAIKLAYWCINLAKHRQHKAAVKVHMVANVANRLPHFCVYGKANEHDSRKEEILFGSLNTPPSRFFGIIMHIHISYFKTRKALSCPP